MGAKVLDELDKYWGENNKKKKVSFFIILCQENIQDLVMAVTKNFIINKLLFSFSLTLQPIKSQQYVSEAELICEETVLFPSLQTASTQASEHLKP